MLFEKPFASNFDNYCCIEKYINNNTILVDHFLYKKDIVRLANKYKNSKISSFEIKFLYSDDVENRLGYFDKTGLFKDMFQSHYLSVLYLFLKEDILKLMNCNIKKNIRKKYNNYGGKNLIDTYFYLEVEVDDLVLVFESGKAVKDKREIKINNSVYTINSYEDEYNIMFNNVLCGTHNNTINMQPLFWKIFSKFEDEFIKNSTIGNYEKVSSYNIELEI